MGRGVFYAGLDVGSTVCELAVVGAEGEGVYAVQFSTNERNMIRAVEEAQEKCRGDFHLAVEEGEMAQWVGGMLRPRVTRLVVCDPKQNYWIARSSQKNDALDALKLATLLRGGYLKEVYHTSDEDRAEFKRSVQHYHDLTTSQAALQCQIKAKFRSRGILVTGAKPFQSEGREKLLKLLANPASREILQQEYGILEKTREAQEQAKRLMVRLGKSFPEVELLRTHPGIGPVWACTFSAYVQTPKRFRRDITESCG